MYVVDKDEFVVVAKNRPVCGLNLNSVIAKNRPVCGLDGNPVLAKNRPVCGLDLNPVVATGSKLGGRQGICWIETEVGS